MGILERLLGILKKFFQKKKVSPPSKTVQETSVVPEEPTQKVDQKEPLARPFPEEGETTVRKKDDTGDAYRILLKPIISEKSSVLASKHQYVFVVNRQAGKIEIRKAIRKVYDVDVLHVTTMMMPGKPKRYGRITGRRRSWKKAIVTIRPDQKIELYEGV